MSFIIKIIYHEGTKHTKFFFISSVLSASFAVNFQGAKKWQMQ